LKRIAMILVSNKDDLRETIRRREHRCTRGDFLLCGEEAIDKEKERLGRKRIIFVICASSRTHLAEI
jgi:hypothetical protein